MEVKEEIRGKISDIEYYRWIDFLDVQISENSIQIIAPYEDAIEHVKTYYRGMIENIINDNLEKPVPISYDCDTM